MKDKGLYEDTIFVYTCDNGWVQDPNRMNTSIRSKREPVEAGIRTPIIITHPGAVKPQRDSSTLASNIDVAPTILKACGIEPPKEMSGLDLRDPEALRQRNRIFVDVYDHDSDLEQLDDIDNGLQARVVIDGWDKLIVRPSGKELYDLQEDPDDRNNLAAQDADKVERLSNIIDEWLESTPVIGK